MTWIHYFGDFGATCTYLFSMLYSLLVTPIFFQICAIEHSPRNFAFGLATPSLSPSPVFSDLTPPVFFLFLFYQLLLPLYLLLQSATTPSPDPNVQFICPMCFYPLVFHNNIP